MDIPKIKAVFYSNISSFKFNKSIKNDLNIFLKKNKINKYYKIKNYKTLDKLNDIFNNKSFKSIKKKLDIYINQYIKTYFNCKFEYSKIFLHIDKKNDYVGAYNFKSDLTFYFCVQVDSKVSNPIIFTNNVSDHGNILKLSDSLTMDYKKIFSTNQDLEFELENDTAIVFPSFLLHFIKQNKSDIDRILIVANINLT